MIITGAIVVVVIGISAIVLLRPVEKEMNLENLSMVDEQKTEVMLELVGLVKTEEEAKELAEAYGIEYKNCSYGIAEFTTDKSYEEIVEIGKQKGLKELSVNMEMKTY